MTYASGPEDEGVHGVRGLNPEGERGYGVGCTSKVGSEHCFGRSAVTMDFSRVSNVKVILTSLESCSP